MVVIEDTETMEEIIKNMIEEEKSLTIIIIRDKYENFLIKISNKVQVIYVKINFDNYKSFKVTKFRLISVCMIVNLIKFKI